MLTIILLAFQSFAFSLDSLIKQQTFLLDEIQLMRNDQSVNFGATYEEVLAAFGPPTSSEPYEYEMKGTTGYLLQYGKCKIYIEEDSLYSWELQDGSIALGRFDQFFRIGDDEQKIQEVFPEILQRGSVSINLKLKDLPLECTSMVIRSIDGKISKVSKFEC